MAQTMSSSKADDSSDGANEGNDYKRTEETSHPVIRDHFAEEVLEKCDDQRHGGNRDGQHTDCGAGECEKHGWLLLEHSFRCGGPDAYASSKQGLEGRVLREDLP
jgi:hypothetical protein